MNIAVLDPRAATPSPRMLMERALEPHILLGMPHLTPHGLSETWLMKELGHRHWLMLALRLGLDNADFRTLDGREAYASICTTSLQETNAGLAGVSANDVIEIQSSLHFLPRNQHSSLHRLVCGGIQICEVELISTFVARSTDGDNHSLARVEQAGSRPQHMATSELAIQASTMRKRASARQKPVEPDKARSPDQVFSPDPGQDFNGAGLLYFANFQAFFAQAVARSTPGEAGFRCRQVFFFGNIRPGETIAVSTTVPSEGGTALQDMRREDGKIIATSRAHR